jgi:hypothetical protein
MLILLYKSKKELKGEIGKPLKYRETSIFGPEYKENGSFFGSNRPSITGIRGREFYAKVQMKDGKIEKVS